MALLKAYFDESGSEPDPQHSVLSLAGYVGTKRSWETLEGLWADALARHNVPYLHMKEFAHFIPPFDKWREKPDERAQFLIEMIEIIARSKLICIGTVVRLPDLRAFNAEKGLRLDAYSLALFGCLIELHELKLHDVEITLDRIDKAESKIAKARALADSDAWYRGCGETIKMSALPAAGNLSSKTILPIQTADFISWELRKSHETCREIYSSMPMDSDPDKVLSAMFNWKVEKSGRWPDERASLMALCKATRMTGALWTYRTLDNADLNRRGIWPADLKQTAA